MVKSFWSGLSPYKYCLYWPCLETPFEDISFTIVQKLTCHYIFTSIWGWAMVVQLPCKWREWRMRRETPQRNLSQGVKRKAYDASLFGQILENGQILVKYHGLTLVKYCTGQCSGRITPIQEPVHLYHLLLQPCQPLRPLPQPTPPGPCAPTRGAPTIITTQQPRDWANGPVPAT